MLRALSGARLAAPSLSSELPRMAAAFHLHPRQQYVHRRGPPPEADTPSSIMTAAMGAVAAIGVVGAIVLNSKSSQNRKGKTVEFVQPPDALPSLEPDGAFDADDESFLAHSSSYENQRGPADAIEVYDGAKHTTVTADSAATDGTRMLNILNEPVKVRVGDGEWVTVTRVMLDTGNLGPTLILPRLAERIGLEPKARMMPVVSVGIHGDARTLPSAKAKVWIKNVELDVVVTLGEVPLADYEMVLGKDVLKVLFDRGFVIGAY
ncbi:uncharacterized protein AMSG_01884 [Thecamonas trahens ATCC 50062]|uniref:Uncharacterized protein n=1 Tax=Thecamonas trahens ATCC 50062 TaxID=461836 RepID=A0A0L0DTP0_THETB|nr:hypothetical protein AMSG_01884 [Thecamonas trahens ATCC 50062]KNC55615.1 hypothetical protein AMSG_01884 [Thecamonas trahens ATCC 50062]|eukprot:XP_013761388.1 hypothetical protein AMSG_01884 [Thecamonas trahens ATCC 50062]